MLNIELNHHTLVMLVGPTGAGKSEFLSYLRGELDSHTVKSVFLSSDDIRRNLLQEDLHKYDPRMLSVSEQAFSLLINDVKIFSSYPISTPFIFIDSRGFDPIFRKEISEIAKLNKYKFVCINFDYKNAADYLVGAPEEEIDIIKADVSKYRRKVLADLRAKDFDKIIRIKSKDVIRGEINLVLPDQEMDLRSNVFNENQVAVIGDSHECVDELETLIDQIKATDATTQFVHVGDYLDKGRDTERMLSFMLKRVLFGDLIVAGNHEAYLYRRLKGEIPPAEEAVEKEYFTALEVLLTNEKCREVFFLLWEKFTLPFVRITGNNQREVIITHAPCNEKYLGKHSLEAARAQRNLYIKDREADLRVGMDFIFKQASPIRPIHVFGHVTHSGPIAFKNKFFLDTGAVNGKFLTAFVIKDNVYRTVQVPSRERISKDIPNNLTQPIHVEKPFNIYDYDLSPEDTKFLNRTLKNGVKYISGTMAPAPSTSTELEPLSSALAYFKDRGVDKVVLEPKYMGSRCQLYIRRGEGANSMAVSRNGYVIKHVEGLPELLEKWENRLAALEADDEIQDWKEIILDGELLPWSALGKGLIDSHFESYGALIQDELNLLAKDEVFAGLDIAKHYDCEGRLAELQVFKDTLALYSQDTPLEFKAFNILSIDGVRPIDNPDELFMACTCWDSTEKCVTIDLSSEESIAEGEEFFKHTTVTRGMEGLVVKPYLNENLELPAKVPEYMKVRNERYLTLVYGYDYKRRYHKLVQQKNISGKVAVSIRESNLGNKMLVAKGDELKELIVKMISELKKEQTLDPRL